jgi:FeS assembly SUF system protein
MIDREYFEQKYPHIVSELHKVYDPEIPLDIFELGLIYNIELNEDDSVDIVMTLTAPNCPVAGQMPEWVEQAVNRAGHDNVRVNLTFEPPWTKEYVSEDGLLALGM